MNVIEFREILEKLWDNKTGWKLHRDQKYFPRSRGQCYCTALMVYTYFGGQVVKGKVCGELHFWNIIDDIGLDLTSDQYGGDGFTPITGTYLIVKRPNLDNKRYIRLLCKYNQYLETKRVESNE